MNLTQRQVIMLEAKGLPKSKKCPDCDGTGSVILPKVVVDDGSAPGTAQVTNPNYRIPVDLIFRSTGRCGLCEGTRQLTYIDWLWNRFNHGTASPDEVGLLENLDPDVPEESEKPKRKRVRLTRRDKWERLPTANLTKEKYARYQYILVSAYNEMEHFNCRLSEADIDFIDSMTERLDKWGRDATVSSKQEQWLEDIVRRIAFG